MVAVEIEAILLLAIIGLMQSVRTFASSAGSAGTELAFGYLLLVAYRRRAQPQARARDDRDAARDQER